jgi:hypothetical protein
MNFTFSSKIGLWLPKNSDILLANTNPANPRKNQYQEAIRQYLLHTVLPIFDWQTIDPATGDSTDVLGIQGSGIILEFDGRQFLVTAGHVLENLKGAKLGTRMTIGGVENVVELPDLWYSTPYPDIDGDPDVAFVEVSTFLSRNLPDIQDRRVRNHFVFL